MSNEPITTLIGNLAADPELRYTQSGTPVCSFTLAQTSRTFNKQTNEWVNGETTWVRCTAWKEFAENIANTLTKGMRVIAQGRWGTRSYEHNGQPRMDVVMQVDAVGPDLRYATAQVTKTTSNAPVAAYDPWAEQGMN